MRDKLAAEKEMPGLNVTEQDITVVATSFSPVFHPTQDA